GRPQCPRLAKTCTTVSSHAMKLILLSIGLFCLPAYAVLDCHHYFSDVELRTTRFASLTEAMRCPKFQNQNLDDSDATVSVATRDKIYEMMQVGASDTEIVAYMVDRYGDFVRYNPPFKAETIILWYGPLLLLLLGVLLLIGMRRNQSRAPAPLTEAEQARLQALKNKAKSS